MLRGSGELVRRSNEAVADIVAGYSAGLSFARSKIRSAARRMLVPEARNNLYAATDSGAQEFVCRSSFPLMNDDEHFLKQVEGIKIRVTNGYRAPHKPLLLLLAFGRILAGYPRLATFRELQGPLAGLLDRFGRPLKRQYPEAPFGFLRTDGLWEIPGGDGLPAGSQGTLNPGPLLARRVRGGFPEHIFRLLQMKPGLAWQAARLLLDRHFPPSLHEDILRATLVSVDSLLDKPANDDFRGEVLEAYGHRCAVCGYGLRMRDETIGLDAAHIQWRVQKGPDLVSNGLALCVLHRAAFDRGAFGLRPEAEGFSVMVSRTVGDQGDAVRRLSPLDGGRILMPATAEAAPKPKFVAWHAKHVFRPPEIDLSGRVM